MLKNESLSTQLCQKMLAEQDSYRKWLLAQSPENILNHTHEYTVREDIVMSMGELDLSEERAAALLKSKSPLADIYKEFSKMSTEHMDNVRSSIESRADSVITREKEDRDATLKAPFYTYSGSYAREHGELAEYRASRKANIACKEAIETAISHTWDGTQIIPLGAHSTLRDFGKDRVEYVLACSLLAIQKDERLPHDNLMWARSISMFEPEDRRYSYIVHSHPEKLNSFVSRTRREIFLKTPLSKDEIQAEAQRILDEFRNAKEPNSPSGTQYMVQISPDFSARGKSRDIERMMRLLPFQTLTFSTLKERNGYFAFISKDENRNQKLRLRRPSIRAQLAVKPEEQKQNDKDAKNMDKDKGAR